MKISSIPVVSAQLYLADLYEPFKTLEGTNMDPLERVWVTVRQATEGDNEKRADLVAKRHVTLSQDGMSEQYDDNVRTRMKWEVYWTLDEVGNLVDDDGKPVFRIKPVREMAFPDFEKVWHRFDSRLANAIHKAVRITNPDWGWGEESGESRSTTTPSKTPS